MSTEYNYNVDTTQATSTSEGIGIDKDYLRTIQGILKIAECVFDIIAFICASAYIWWAAYGGGWVQFVTMSAFITTLVLFFFHFLRIIYKLPGPWNLIEFIYYGVYTLMMLICFIVAAAKAGYYGHSAVIATAVFTFVTTALYGVDTFFQFRNWQESRSAAHSGGGGDSTTTTTTTHTTYETKTQY